MMFDFDAAIIGGGPAGLTAGLYLSQSKYRTIILEKESFGGHLMNTEWIENYPGFAEGVDGAHLASEMINRATECGLQLEQTEVTGIELYTSSRWVKCTGGKGYTATVVIIAGGFGLKKLGVPGEDALRGKGVFTCALCERGLFADRVVAVCGGGDAGITEALHLTKTVSKVILVEAGPALTATDILKEKALADPKLDIRCGVRVEAIVGDSRVEAIELLDTASGRRETIKVDGVLVRIGAEPNTNYLRDIVPLDSQGQIIVNDRMETGIPYILAAGDIRSGASRQIVAAVDDGKVAATTAQKLLQELA